MVPSSAELIFVVALVTIAITGQTLAMEAQYVSGLQSTANMSLVQDLKLILNSSQYSETYEAGKFDCIDTCAITQKILQEHGYKPIMIMRAALKSSSEESHLWLAVPDGVGCYAFIETTIFAFQPYGLGGVVMPEDVRTMGYDQGYIIDDLSETSMKLWSSSPPRP